MEKLTDHNRKCLRMALMSFADAGRRWDDRAAKGLTDDELSDAVEYELGSYGGYCGDDIQVAYKGSPSAVYIGAISPHPGPGVTEVKGKDLLDAARAEFGIPKPGGQLRLPF